MVSVLDTSNRQYASINGVCDEPLLIIREFKDRYWLDGHLSYEAEKAFVVTDVMFNLRHDHDGNCILSVAKKNCTLFTIEQVIEFERNHSDPASYDTTYLDLCREIDNDFAILSEQSRDRLKALLRKMAGKVVVDEPINCARVVW